MCGKGIGKWSKCWVFFFSFHILAVIWLWNQQFGVNDARRSPKFLGLLFQCCYPHWKELFQFSVIDFSVTMFSVTVPSLSVQLNVLLDSEPREGCRDHSLWHIPKGRGCPYPARSCCWVRVCPLERQFGISPHSGSTRQKTEVWMRAIWQRERPDKKKVTADAWQKTLEVKTVRKITC